jgi:hypothetical protein
VRIEKKTKDEEKKKKKVAEDYFSLYSNPRISSSFSPSVIKKIELILAREAYPNPLKQIKFLFMRI